jgi:hypothetical protein
VRAIAHRGNTCRMLPASQRSHTYSDTALTPLAPGRGE